MFRKTIVGLVVVAGLMFLVKRTSFLSYAGTLWDRTTKEAKEQVPTRFEIERARREITAMDGDIGGALRPIAEYMAAISRLKKDIKTSRDALAEQKTSILAMTRDLEGNPDVLTYDGEKFSAERVRKKLQGDFESYKRCESHLKSQEKLLEAKERSLAASREQLSKLVTKKRDYEIRLAQLEADEETLQTARLGSKLPLNDNRSSEIELANGPQAHDFIPVRGRSRSGAVANVDEIRQHLGAN